jgi:hypothetical protein
MAITVRHDLCNVIAWCAHTGIREHFQETVTLVIGAQRKAYNVHKDLLCFYSDYFRAAFHGSFKEAKERKIELPSVEEDIFENFQLWLYTRRLDFTELSFGTLVSLWIFGDQHEIPLLQNCVIDGLFEKQTKENQFDYSVATLVYDNTLPGSPLHRAITEIGASYVWDEDSESFPNPMHCPAEHLIDLIRAEARLPKDGEQYSLLARTKCFFHIHGKDEHC